ncbi:hypothetical protein BRD00_04470 [Halobacteriales archaeon QS_8_69_26]|nr:MAG: hypothetical protein BRD00_04470 [Halobacteriales archaeon QS_8_69_26]
MVAPATSHLSGVGTAAFWQAGAPFVAPMVAYKVLHRRGSRLLFEVGYRLGRRDWRLPDGLDEAGRIATAHRPFPP